MYPLTSLTSKNQNNDCVRTVIQVQEVSGPPDGLKDQVRVNTLSMSFRAPLEWTEDWYPESNGEYKGAQVL